MAKTVGVIDTELRAQLGENNTIRLIRDVAPLANGYSSVGIRVYLESNDRGEIYSTSMRYGYLRVNDGVPMLISSRGLFHIDANESKLLFETRETVYGDLAEIELSFNPHLTLQGEYYFGVSIHGMLVLID